MDVLNVTDSHDMLTALADVYISIHLFDLKKDVIMAFKSNQFIDKWSDEVSGAQNKINNVMKNITLDEHLEMMMEFIDLSTITERLEGKNNISLVFEGKINGWCRARFCVMDWEEGVITRLIFAVECINEEKKRENHLLYLAGTDLMTGLFNRGHGENSIEALFQKGQKGMFCLFDVDKFKQVNDKYGHNTGDEVLIAVADCLRKVHRDGDVIMRLGGDEFAAFFRDIDEAEAGAFIQKLFEEIDKISVEPMQEPVRISLGATFYRENMNFDEAYKMADRGVYESKHSKQSSFLIV